MQQHHLTAWAQHAPWPKRSQLEQDLRITRGVSAIFADAFLRRTLAMRGGTILHKGHLAPAARYSEDIDLVIIDPHVDVRAVEKRLRVVLADELGRPSDTVYDTVKLWVRNAVGASNIMRIQFGFVPLGLQRAETIKVETNTEERTPLYAIVDVPMLTLDADGSQRTVHVRSFDINEMLGTKIRALMQRTQGRDLFDLWHAWDLSQKGATPYSVDPKLTVHAFLHYVGLEGRGFSRQEAEKRLQARLRKKSFRTDMATMLRPDMIEFDPHRAAEMVRDVFFGFLEKDPIRSRK